MARVLCALVVSLAAVGAGALAGRWADSFGEPARAAAGLVSAAAATAPPPLRIEIVPAPSPPAPALEAPRRTTLGETYRDGLVITGATPHRIILFTFDDGPDRRTTPVLLDRLDAAGVHAVFFLSCARLRGTIPAEREQIAIAQETARRGHIVASHTCDHIQLPILDDVGVRAQLTEAEDIFEKLFGGRPWLVRPPGGSRSPRIDHLIAARGYTQVLWNLGAGDFQVRTATDVYDTWRRVFERRERDYGDRGGIVLLHDTYAWSVDAFQLIYDDLMAQNCRFLERGEELFDVLDDPGPFFVPRLGAPPGAVAPGATLPPEWIAGRQARLREETAQRCRAISASPSGLPSTHGG